MVVPPKIAFIALQEDLQGDVGILLASDIPVYSWVSFFKPVFPGDRNLSCVTCLGRFSRRNEPPTSCCRSSSFFQGEFAEGTPDVVLTLVMQDSSHDVGRWENTPLLWYI